MKERQEVGIKNTNKIGTGVPILDLREQVNKTTPKTETMNLPMSNIRR